MFVSSLYNNQVFRYFNDGTGALLRQYTPAYPLAKMPFGVGTGTIDEDGYIDVTLAFEEGGPDHWSGGGGCVATLFMTSGGTVSSIKRFNPTPQEIGQPKPTFVRVVDMNRDFRRDLVVSCTGNNFMSVLLNRGGSGLPTPGDGGSSESESESSQEEITDCAFMEADGLGWDSLEGPFDYPE